MQVTIEDVNTVTKILHIEVPEETVANELDSAYTKLKKTAKVNGFRPGKAPRAVLERKFKSDVHADVQNQLIQASLFQAIQENELKYIGEPIVEDLPELDPKSAYKFSAKLELLPELGDVDFRGIKVKKTIYEPSEGEVDAQIEMIRKNLAKREAVAVDRAAEQNDFILVDYEGLREGEPFGATPKTENASHKIGSAVLSNDFDDQLVGMKPGDVKEFEIDYAPDYVNRALAGNKIAFTVKLNAIQEEVLPEVDDELAKRVGAFETLEALRQAIMDNLTSGYEKRMEQEISEQIYTDLIEKVSFDVPDMMVQYELANIIAEAENAFMMNGISLEQIGKTREDLEKEYSPLAEKQVRRHLILGAIMKQENLELTDEEMDEGYAETARAINQPVEGIKAFYKANPDKIEYFRHTLLEKKALKLIIENSDIEEVKPETESEQGE